MPAAKEIGERELLWCGREGIVTHFDELCRPGTYTKNQHSFIQSRRIPRVVKFRTLAYQTKTEGENHF